VYKSAEKLFVFSDFLLFVIYSVFLNTKATSVFASILACRDFPMLISGFFLCGFLTSRYFCKVKKMFRYEE